MIPAPVALTWPTRLRIFVPFALGYFLSYLFRGINAVLAPNLVHDIGVDPSQLGLLTGAYFAMLLLVLQVPLAPAWLWSLFGFFGTSGILLYAVLSQSFASHLSGRANTAFGICGGVWISMGHRRGRQPVAGFRNRRICTGGLSGGVWCIAVASSCGYGLVLVGRPVFLQAARCGWGPGPATRRSLKG